MYEAYWKLKEKPFDNVPDPRFIYNSQKHEEALSRMLYAVTEGKGAAILTGEYGSGKTLLSRVLLSELSNDHYQSALIFNPKLPPLELLKEIVYQLGGGASSLIKTDLLHTLNEILFKNWNSNKKTVVVIDEAQTVPEESLEELRLLLNFQFSNSFLFTLILLGQPELKNKINNLPQLKQRFAVRYHIKSLTEDQVKEYVVHRLEVAGRDGEIFQEDSFGEIYRFSAGVPRRINNICDMALLVGCGKNSDKIDKEIIREVAQDLGETPIDAEEKARILSDG